MHLFLFQQHEYNTRTNSRKLKLTTTTAFVRQYLVYGICYWAVESSEGDPSLFLIINSRATRPPTESWRTERNSVRVDNGNITFLEAEDGHKNDKQGEIRRRCTQQYGGHDTSDDAWRRAQVEPHRWSVQFYIYTRGQGIRIKPTAVGLSTARIWVCRHNLGR